MKLYLVLVLLLNGSPNRALASITIPVFYFAWDLLQRVPTLTTSDNATGGSIEKTTRQGRTEPRLQLDLPQNPHLINVWNETRIAIKASRRERPEQFTGWLRRLQKFTKIPKTKKSRDNEKEASPRRTELIPKTPLPPKKNH